MVSPYELDMTSIRNDPWSAEADSAADDQRSSDLLCDAQPKRSEINRPVEFEGTGTSAQGSAANQRELREIHEGLAERSQRQRGPSTETQGFLVVPGSVRREGAVVPSL